MATVTRERIIANPARRRLSRAQIAAGFGGKRRQSAQRSNRRNRSSRSKARHRRRRSNPGEIIGYTFANNPARKRRKRSNMAAATKHRRRRRSNAGYRRNRRKNRGLFKTNPRHHAVRHRRRHRSNPRRHRRYHVRRNPGMGRITDIAINATFVIVGALGSKLLTQMVLGSNNVGLIGYAGNAVAGGILWWIAETFLKNKEAANGIVSGTAVQIILRLINDYTPFGQYVSSLGMGDYQAQAFVTPQVLVDPYNNAQIAIPGAWQPQMIAAPVAATGTGVGDLYGGRSDLY